MMKKFVILLSCIALSFELSACSLFSGEKKSEDEMTTNAEAGELEKLDSDEASQTQFDEKKNSENQNTEEALGESQAEPQAISAEIEQQAGVESALNSQESNTSDSLPVDPFAEPEVASGSAEKANDAEKLPPLPSSDTTVVDNAISTPIKTSNTKSSFSADKFDTSSSATQVDTPPKAPVPLQKIAMETSKAGNILLNTVYIARPGDNLKKISKMIYGKDRSAELKKANKFLNSRSVKAGDKIYYNSPNRPDDAARMITYFEDNGITPDVYVSRSGDNLKKVSSKLLGFSNAWKEIWATNAIDSKDSLPEGTELHYWKLAPQPATTVSSKIARPSIDKNQFAAKNPSNNMEMENSIPTAPEPQPEVIPQASADIPPPPPLPESAPQMAQTEQLPPPPPVEAINPPSPPQADEFKKSQDAPEEESTNPLGDEPTILAIVGIAATGLALLIVMRKKKKQKEFELQQSMDDSTHVGT